MCILSRPLRAGEILRNFGGKNRNDLNQFLKSDEIDTDIDLSSYSPYVTLDFLPKYLNDAKSQLSTLSLNAQCLPAKYDKIKIALEHWIDEQLEFCSLNFQESWLLANDQGNVDTTQYEFSGYNSYAAGATCSSHGGVITYIKEYLQV